MLARQYNLAGNERNTPPPISALIQAANLFGCDIYIKAEQKKLMLRVTTNCKGEYSRRRSS